MRTWWLFIFIAWLPQGSLASPDGTLRLGVHPFLGSAELMEKFTPLVDYLSNRLAQPVELFISADYTQHIVQIGRGGLDIAYLGPAPYVRLTARYGPQPLLVRLHEQGASSFRGVIVSRHDSPLTELSQLSGKRFAFGDPQSTMSHLVPTWMLAQAGVSKRALADFEFLHNHENVAFGVLSGRFDAGAVKESVYHEFREQGLKALAWSPPLPTHLLVASSHLEPSLVTRLRELLMELNHSPQGLAVLQAIKPALTGVEAVADSDYNQLRDILRQLEQE